MNWSRIPREHTSETTVLDESGVHLHTQLINIILTFTSRFEKWLLLCEFCDSCVFSLFFVLKLIYEVYVQYLCTFLISLKRDAGLVHFFLPNLNTMFTFAISGT